MPNDQEQEYYQYLNVYCHDMTLLRYLFGNLPTLRHVESDKPEAQVAILDFGGHIELLEPKKSPWISWNETAQIYFSTGRINTIYRLHS